jgi:RHS repeat-associated protein
LPFPLPKDVYVPIYFTVQPGGAYVGAASSSYGKGARLIYPNYRREGSGTRFDFWHYDPDGKGWYVYGKGTVADDQRQIVPDPGVAIQEFTGAMVALPSTAPGTWPVGGKKGGDPVDLGTGLFVLNQTDLALPDTISISLTRTYRPQDSITRSFGIGTSHAFEIFLIGNTNPWTYIELVLPDGGRIHFDRISPGTSYTDAVYEHTSTPTGFYKSHINWDPSIGWNLTLKNGTVYSFRGGDGATVARQAGLLRVRDRNGNTVSVIRDTSSNLTRLLSPNGRYIDFTYDATNRVTQAKDNIGRTVSYTYDASGRLWKVTDPMGGVTEYTYDASHRMLTIKDARGIVYLTNQYDTNGRIGLQTQADGTTYQFAYTLDGNGKVTQTDVTDPRGNVSRTTFNDKGYVLTDIYAVGTSLQQTYTYTRQTGTNLPLSATDQLGRLTSLAYDSMGNVISITRLAGTADAITSSVTYEPVFNQVATVTDPLNHSAQFGYDSKGNLTSVADPLSNQTTFGYSSTGQATSATNALGKTTQLGYDSGDLVTVTGPLGQTVNSFVDSAGRVLSVTDPIGRTAKLEYDLLNRPTRVTDPLQGATASAYDPNGNVLSVTDPRNNAISYVYDNMDRVQSRTDPLLRASTYLYDNNGNLRQATDRKSQVTTSTYDALNRLTLVTYANSSTSSYTYDSGNRLTQVIDSISGTITYTYDSLDRVTSEATPQGTVSYTYDAAGRRTTMAVPGQATVSYSYDNGNRLTQISQSATMVSFSYDASSRVTTQTLPNGVVTEYAYDDASRLTSLTYKKSGNTLGNLTYGYDSTGRRTRIGGTLATTGLPQAVTSTTYNSANQQTGFGGQTLTYDNNGNLTSDGTNTYTWNARNQLVSMSGPGLSASFQYDALGRRSGKTINAVTTGFLYDGLNIVQEQSGGSASANVLTGAIDQLFSRSDSSGTANSLTDALGSVTALTDSNGTIQTQYTYEPFGKTTATGATSNNPSKYTGREDDETGLYYYRARYYSPNLQRFISEDPIGLAGGSNLYAYVHNNPVSFTDALGLKPNEPWISEVAFCAFLGRAGSFAAGFGDTITGGLTDKARDWTRANDAVDKGSGWYQGGTYAGYAWEAAAAYAAVAQLAANAAATTANAGNRLVTVSRWGREGLESGDWVMKGEASWSNYIRSFKWQPGLGNEFAPFSSGASYRVPVSSIRWPSGLGIDGLWKGLFGQRIYIP